MPWKLSLELLSFINISLRSFTLIRDHRPLTLLLGPNRDVTVLAASRLQRWAIQLSAYLHGIEYRAFNLRDKVFFFKDKFILKLFTVTSLKQALRQQMIGRGKIDRRSKLTAKCSPAALLHSLKATVGLSVRWS